MSGRVLAPLVVMFVDERREIDPADERGLVFGRGAALDIDSNPFLHRQVGRFVPCDGWWWVENLSSWTAITVTGGGTSALVAGGSRVALVHTSSLVSFTAGSCNYEVHASLPSVPEVGASPLAPPSDLTATYRPVSIPLTDEQRLLVVALAEPRLRTPHARSELPSNRAVAERLGWSPAKFNRKLDYLCRRLDRVGVEGMRVDGRRANFRRERLVEHMVADAHVTVDDLSLLDAYPASSGG
jgi:hypothetical protein